MYIYQDQGIIIDLSAVISNMGQLAELYGNADYATLKKITDFIDGQTVDYVRSCLALGPKD